MAEGKTEKKKLKFSDSELQILTDEEQRLLTTARSKSHCIREESQLGWHFSVGERCRCFEALTTDSKRQRLDLKRLNEFYVHIINIIRM